LLDVSRSAGRRLPALCTRTEEPREEQRSNRSDPLRCERCGGRLLGGWRLTRLGAAAAVALAVLSGRRLALLAAASLPPRKRGRERDSYPPVTVIVPAYNEEGVLDTLLEALDRLVYPGPVSFVLVCDGCTDGTPARFRRWAEGRSEAQVVALDRRVGKAAALNAGLALATGDLVVALDADLRPQPDLVLELAGAFADPKVAAAAAFIQPVNADANVVTRYGALNGLVHQLVTSAAKDRLGLNPPTFGASAYRRNALTHIDGFCATFLGVDVESTIALTSRGWRTRFVPTAVAEHRVSDSLCVHWHQHVRWTRATLNAAKRREAVAQSPLLDTVEGWMVVAGNADRIVVALASILAATRAASVWPPLGYLGLRGLDIAAALAKFGSFRRLPAFALSGLVMFPVDVSASLAGFAAAATRRAPRWYSSRPAGG
jgi:GT2 family glycosyltransferase